MNAILINFSFYYTFLLSNSLFEGTQFNLPFWKEEKEWGLNVYILTWSTHILAKVKKKSKVESG